MRDRGQKKLWKDAISEFRHYKGASSYLKTNEMRMLAERLRAHEFWKSEGTCYIAMRVPVR